MSLRGFDFGVRRVWNIELSHWLWMTLAALATDDEDVLVQRHQLGALDAALVSWERTDNWTGLTNPNRHLGQAGTVGMKLCLCTYVCGHSCVNKRGYGWDVWEHRCDVDGWCRIKDNWKLWGKE